jgi:hypothetical protein
LTIEERLSFSVDHTTTLPPTADLWAFFDRIFCISLEERVDRRLAAADQFRKVGLAGRVEFVIVQKHPTDSEQGIFESHLDCFRAGLKDDAETMLIFEDDVVFDRFDPHVLAECTRFLSSDTSWTVFFFGCLASSSRQTEHRSVVKVRYRSLAHAYAIQRRFAETLIACRWRGTPFDTMLRDVGPYYFAAYPAFAFQDNSRTDNMSFLKRDRWRRMCGGLRRIQKVNEWYLRHRPVVIGFHLVAIVILMIWAARLLR